MILFTGGVRSGKSALAQAWAEMVRERQLYIATCKPLDSEMRERVALHREKRGPSWLCLEESVRVQPAIEDFIAKNPQFRGALLLDSVDMLLNNLLAEKLPANHILEIMEELFVELDKLSFPCAVVSAECGLGFIPASPLGRLYGDLLGLINQRAAKICETVIFVSCGLPLVLKGVSPWMELKE